MQGLDGPVTAVARQLVVDLSLDHGDLAVEDLQQVTQRLDPQLLGTLKGHVAQQLQATRAEHVRERRQDADLGHHCVPLGLGRGAQGHQLGPLCRGRDYAELFLKLLAASVERRVSSA